MPDYMPSRGADRVNWIKQFAAKIQTLAASVGLTSGQASAFQTLSDNLDAAYSLTLDGDTRTPAGLIAKDQAMDIAVASARQLVRIVQAFPGTTDEMRRTLSISIKSVPTPIPVPAMSPVMEITSVVGHRVSVLLHAPGTTRRGLPDGVDGIAVFSFAGEVCPTDPNKFKFEANTLAAHLISSSRKVFCRARRSGLPPCILTSANSPESLQIQFPQRSTSAECSSRHDARGGGKFEARSSKFETRFK